MAVVLETVEELYAKYGEMLEMRLEHLSPDEDVARAKARMAKLASRFPGALREIDDLELSTIRARLARLNGVLQGEIDAEPWMEAVGRFHVLARGALCAKRWLGGRKLITAAIERDYLVDVERMAYPEDARAWSGHLASVAVPPRGRLMDVVFRRLALSLGRTELDMRRLVLGVASRRKG